MNPKFLLTVLVVLVVLAAVLGVGAAGPGALTAAPNSSSRPDEKRAIVEDARRLLESSRTHVSYAALLVSLEQRMMVLASKCPDANAGAFAANDLGVRTAMYRNVSVAAQQTLQVVVEKAEQWPAAKLKPLLDRGRADLQRAEDMRAAVAPEIATSVLGQTSSETVAEVRTGLWAGSQGKADANDSAKAPAPAPSPTPAQAPAKDTPQPK